MNPPEESSAGNRLHRVLLMALAGLAVVLVWLHLGAIAAAMRWHDHAEVSMPQVVNALALNSGVPPARLDAPGFTSQYLLALDLRARHEAGWQVWNLRRLDASADPLAALADVAAAGRQHSRFLVLAVLVAAAGLAWRVTRSVETACLAVVLLAGSAGLLFHGLLNRPELLAAGLGTVLAPLCLWAAGTATGARRDAWLFGAGLAGGWAALALWPAAVYLATGFAWCWLAAWSQPTAPAGQVPPSPATRWLLPLAGSLGTLGLLHLLAGGDTAPGGDVALRLRLASVLVALLPLLTLSPSPLRRGSFVRERLGELALLGGGALATLPLSFLLLRAVMPAPVAAGSMGELLQFLLHPVAPVPAAVPTASHLAVEFVRFVRAAPFLFAGAAVLAVGTVVRREIPPRLRTFVFLLLANGLVVVLLLSRERFADPASLFAQVPFLLAWAVALHGLGLWQPAAGRGSAWAAPIAIIAAAVLLATVPLRLRPRFPVEDGTTPRGINDETVTYLYNHNALPEPYVALMERHYPTRRGFVQALERQLALPPAPP